MLAGLKFGKKENEERCEQMLNTFRVIDRCWFSQPWMVVSPHRRLTWKEGLKSR